MGKDLGTYHIKVIFSSGMGYIQHWGTGAGYSGCSDEVCSLAAQRTQPLYDDEADLIKNIKYMYDEGVYADDGNRRLFLARAHKDPSIEFSERDMRIASLTLIRPDGSEQLIYQEPEDL
jgi:hypothetical protein